jgi:hypothetical protein
MLRADHGEHTGSLLYEAEEVTPPITLTLRR